MPMPKALWQTMFGTAIVLGSLAGWNLADFDFNTAAIQAGIAILLIHQVVTGKREG